MSKNTLIAMCGGAISGLASMLILTGSPGAMLFVYLSPLPLLVVGLSLGAPAAAVAGSFGFLISALLGGVVAAGIYAIAHAMPAWLIVRQALLRNTAAGGGGITWYPAGSILCWLVLLGASVFLFAAMINTGGTDGLEAIVGEYLNEIFASMAPAMISLEAYLPVPMKSLDSNTLSAILSLSKSLTSTDEPDQFDRLTGVKFSFCKIISFDYATVNFGDYGCMVDVQMVQKRRKSLGHLSGWKLSFAAVDLKSLHHCLRTRKLSSRKKHKAFYIPIKKAPSQKGALT